MEPINVYVNQRIEKFQAVLKELKISGALLVKPENVFYLSNFNPILNSHPAYLLVTQEDTPCLLIHCLRYHHAREEAALENIQCYARWGDAPSVAPNAIEAIEKLAAFKKFARFAFEMDYISVNLHRNICDVLGIAESIDLAPLLNPLRLIKDPWELDHIRGAAALVDRGVERTIEALDQGCSEADACTEGQYAMRQLWSRQYSQWEVSGFGTSEGGMIDSLHVWSLTNERIACGTDCPRPVKPVSGDLSLPMAWASLGGYHAENERTLEVGTIAGIREKAYEAVLAARKALFDRLKPGAVFKDLYAAAVEEFHSRGFGNILPGRVGHGVGLSAHEFPSIAPENTAKLEPDMVITVEPGLMDKNWGGVRHSDTVLITPGGYEKLTRLSDGKIAIMKHSGGLPFSL
jgi:Xaa-Pro dipeptidase